MNQVYICADFGSDGAENIRKATRYAGFVYGHDMIPIAPAMYSGALNLSKPKDLHRMGETRKCKLWNGSELWVFGDRTTPEMREEIRSFQAINGANARIRVRHRAGTFLQPPQTGRQKIQEEIII